MCATRLILYPSTDAALKYHFRDTLALIRGTVAFLDRGKCLQEDRLGSGVVKDGGGIQSIMRDKIIYFDVGKG